MGDSDEEIAVVGIGCNFPGGEGLANFWKILLEGKNCTIQIPDDRFDSAFWHDSDGGKAGKTQTVRAALIDGLNEFDHKFFGITEAEADLMDPQQKLLLECTYRALENAGIPMEKASGTRTGVFIGLMNRDYETLLSNSPTTITHYNGTGTAMSIAANRISYTFNFTGPSLAIDSACSSSLVALHYAAHAIRQGDCDMAVCGGVSCILEPRVFVALSKAKMISPDGSSKPFSSRADGYGRGEGCGIVLLKPLKKALRDSDHVWGIITKTAVNQDGRSVTPITRPSSTQQEELLQRIYSAGFDPSYVQYIEAHGTGTPVGDPTEAGSISRTIAKAKPAGEALSIGSVKGNIGHTESAAGVAGLIKVLLMMHHKTIVPSLFYSEDKASIDVKSMNLRIPTRTEKWEKSGPAGRAAGINNFGFGGTNAHAIVREYGQIDSSTSVIQDTTKLFVLSAASEKSLTMTISDTCQELARNRAVDLNCLAYTSASRRSHLKHKYRKVFLTSSLGGLQEQLRLAITPRIAPVKSGLKSVFVFCGNGVTYRGMCKELLRVEPIFREKVLSVEKLYQKYKNVNLLQILEIDNDNDDYSKPNVVQPLLFAIQVAIFNLLKHWGVRADAILGHSVGEVAAAHCSGLLSLEDAVKVIHFRSMLQSKVTGGKMLVVSKIEVSEILSLLPAYSGRVCLAAFNSPQSCTLSGEADAIESLHHKLKTSFNNKNLFLHILDVPAAYHSRMMDPILDQIENSIGSLQENEMETDLFSTVTGEMRSQGDFTSGKYWSRNVREPVKFEKALRSAAKNKKNIVFVEIGPRRALQRNIMETLGNDITVLPTVQPNKDHETLLTAVSKLFELGVNVNWQQLYKGQEAPLTSFPRYQFDCVKKEVYFEAVRRGNEGTSQVLHPVVRPSQNSNTEFSCDFSSEATWYLREHKNNGIALIPGTLYVDLALTSFLASVKSNTLLNSLELSINFQSPFILSETSPKMKVHVVPSEKAAEFKIHCQSATYASGAIEWNNGSLAPEEKKISLKVVFKRCQTVIKAEQAYTILSQAGFQYGSVFRQLGDVNYGEEFKEAISAFKVPEEITRQLQSYCIHPVVLDHFMQMTAVVSGNRFESRPGFPSGIGCITVCSPLQNEMIMYLRTARETPDGFEVCGCFTDIGGNVLVELKHVKITLLGGGSQVTKEFLFHNEQCATFEAASPCQKPKALVFADQLGMAESLQQHLHSCSTFFWFKTCQKLAESTDREFFKDFSVYYGKHNFKEVLFMYGLQDLSHMKTEIVLNQLAECCEFLRKIVLALKRAKYMDTIRIITFRSAEETVDHFSPGFVLSGMTRACAAEISGFSFQLIDLASSTNEDIMSLAHVLCFYSATKYPELTITKGHIYSSEITHTSVTTPECPEKSVHSSGSGHFILQTADPYRMSNLSAVTCFEPGDLIHGSTVEVQLNKICVHSSDYFPVSVSGLIFGQTMYWNKHTSQNHNLLALDFSGTITAVGKDVGKLKVGDHVVSCYPITASSKVVIPEAACYRTKKLPFLKEVPCISFFVLAWEILHRALPKVRQRNKLGIISLEADSNLVQVLMFTADRSGWNGIVGTQFSGLLQNVNKCDAFVLLPPFDSSLVAAACSVSTVRNIVLVSDDQVTSDLLPNILKSDSENICVQIIQVANLFQKGYLKKQKRLINNWLKSMRLPQVPVLKSSIFQRINPESTESPSVQESKSYFSSDTTSVVVFDGNCKDEISHIPVQKQPNKLFLKRAVYIVTGGLSGLGFETVKFIAQRGGGCIAILSRRSSSHLQHEISSLQNQYGVSVISIQCDVSVSEQVVNAVTTIGQKFPSYPIRGVFHSAVVLHDGLLETLDKSHYEKVFRPKVNGALNLHHATSHCKLDYFVCYSSISSFIGNATQSNYAAANSFLDMFCHYRRRLGLAAQSINWGALNLGLLKDKESMQRFLETKGMMVMNVAEFLEGLEHCLLLNNPQQVVCKFSFKNLKKHVLSQNTSLKIRLTALVDEELKDSPETESRGQLLAPSSSPGDYIRTMLSETCNVDLQDLSDDATLSALGVDSMVSMTLQNLIFQEKGVNVPLVKLLDPNSTIFTLVSMLDERDDWQLRKDAQKLSLNFVEDDEVLFTQF